MSFVKPVLHIFHSSILAIQEDDTVQTQSIKVSILDYPREKFADPATNDLLDMASLVDPRFKTQTPRKKRWRKSRQCCLTGCFTASWSTIRATKYEKPWTLLQRGNNILNRVDSLFAVCWHWQWIVSPAVVEGPWGNVPSSPLKRVFSTSGNIVTCHGASQARCRW